MVNIKDFILQRREDQELKAYGRADAEDLEKLNTHTVYHIDVITEDVFAVTEEGDTFTLNCSDQLAAECEIDELREKGKIGLDEVHGLTRYIKRHFALKEELEAEKQELAAMRESKERMSQGE